MTENIIQFVKPSPQVEEEIEFASSCDRCLCADACSKFNLLDTDESKDAWIAECEKVAAEKGGFRSCDTAVEMGESNDGIWYYYRDGVKLHPVYPKPGGGA